MRDLYSIILFLTLVYPALLWAETEVSYSYIPKQVYENQVFPVTITTAPTESNDTIRSMLYDTSSKKKALFGTPLVVKNGNDAFYTFYFKAPVLKGNIKSIRIPRLFIRSELSRSSLGPVTIPVRSLDSLHPPKEFIGILAASIRIKNYQVSNYDTQNHLVTISLEAYEANLEDIKAPHAIQSGIEDLYRKDAKVTGDFYVVLPKTQKIFNFSYYDTVKRTFVTLHVKTELENASVSTQSDLNPKVDAFERLKRYSLIALSLFFISMFLWKKDLFYLVLGVVSLLTLMTFYIPHKKICIKQGAPLYILPTQTSTVSTHVSERLTTMLLDQRGEFKKIELRPGVIGWIKDEEICKE